MINLPGVPALPGKSQRKGQQVDGQRQDPQEGNDSHLLGEVAGGCQEKYGGAGTQGNPEEIIPGGWFRFTSMRWLFVQPVKYALTGVLRRLPARRRAGNRLTRPSPARAGTG